MKHIGRMNTGQRFFLLIFSMLITVCSKAQTTPMHDKGYQNTFTFGVLAGASTDEKPAPLSIIMEHNYRVIKYFAPGIITGIEQLNENIAPVALLLKVFWPLKRCDLFINTYGGYAFSLNKPEAEGMRKALGGFTSGLESGISIPVNNGSAITLAIGYCYCALNYKLEDAWINNYERKITYNRLSFRMGITLF
jgi:hypothetical protein